MIYYSTNAKRIGKMLLAKLIEFNIYVEDMGITHEKYPHFFSMPECDGLHVSFYQSDWRTQEGIDTLLNYADMHDSSWKNGSVSIEVYNPCYNDVSDYEDVAVPVTALNVNVAGLLELYHKRFPATAQQFFKSTEESKNTAREVYDIRIKQLDTQLDTFIKCACNPYHS